MPALFSLLLVFFLVLSPLSAFADWEAKFLATSSKKEFSDIAGRVYSRPDRIRVDSPYPMEMSVFARNGSRRVSAAVHSFRIRLTSNLEAMGGPIPACLAKSFEACVGTLKLKKIASEKCGENDCEVFEGNPKAKGVKSVRLWHRVGEKEAILAKAIVAKTDGGALTVAFSEIVKKSHPEAFFTVPSGYKDAGSLDRFFGDLKGKSEPE